MNERMMSGSPAEVGPYVVHEQNNHSHAPAEYLYDTSAQQFHHHHFQTVDSVNTSAQSTPNDITFYNEPTSVLPNPIIPQLVHYE